MNRSFSCQSCSREQALLNIWALTILPILVVFPRTTGWISAPIIIWGVYIAIKYRIFLPADRFFLAVCLILPVSILFNMPFMGWDLKALARPNHLVAGFFIYLVIGRYGLRRNVLFWGACAATLIALCIALYEVVYLGNPRVFGLAHRWNAVPFGNFSLLLAFFCLAGASIVSHDDSSPWPRVALGLAGFGCGLAASVLSGTRGGWLAIPFLVLLCIWFNNHLSKRMRGMTLIVLLAAIVSVMALSDRIAGRIEQATEQVHAYLANPTDPAARNTSTGLRLSMWHWGIERFKEHPFTGIGYSSYEDQREDAVLDAEMPNSFIRFANLHNEVITRLALGGLPAAMAVFLFWFMAWRFFATKMDRQNIGEQHYYALCGLLTIVGTGLFSMTESLFGTSAGTKAIMLLLAIPAGAVRYAWASRQHPFAVSQTQVSTA